MPGAIRQRLRHDEVMLARLRALGFAAALAVAAVSQDTRPAPATASRPESRPTPLRLAPLPDRRHGHRAEVLPDGRVVVFGGFDNANLGGDRGQHASWLFDPAKSGWAKTGDLNTEMAFHASVVAGGSVYAIGGNVERFDAAVKKWEVVMSGEPFAKSHLTAAADGTRVLLVGGFPESRPRLAMVDVAEKKWDAVPPYPGFDPQDHFDYVAALSGRFHVAGGFSGKDFQPHTRHHAWDGHAWIPRAPIPEPDGAKFASWAVDSERGRLVIFGMNGDYAYDARSDSWAPLRDPPWDSYRVMPATFVREGYLYVLGGIGDGRVHGVDVFDLVSGRWVR
jgi:hypothetical protein